MLAICLDVDERIFDVSMPDCKGGLQVLGRKLVVVMKN